MAVFLWLCSCGGVFVVVFLWCGVRYFGTQSLILFGFNIAEPHLVARPLKEREKKKRKENIVLLCNM